MLDENRCGDTAGKMVFLPKEVVLLKVLHDWFLWMGERCGIISVL